MCIDTSINNGTAEKPTQQIKLRRYNTRLKEMLSEEKRVA
jgi:hypothetical protein